MSHTVHLILDLEPDTKYEVKARMYSNAGIGPFSEPQVVSTDVGELRTSSNKLIIINSCAMVDSRSPLLRTVGSVAVEST